jgi:hypothetical protein
MNFSRIDIHRARDELEKDFPALKDTVQTTVSVHAGALCSL